MNLDLKNCCLIFLCLGMFACTSNRVGTPYGVTDVYIKGIYSLPLTFDPIQMNDTASLLVSNLIYDGLLKFAPDLSIKGALAQSWSSSEAGKAYTFVLRPDAYFHDGSQITARAVVKSLSRALSQNSTVYKYYDCIVGADDFHSGKKSFVSGLVVKNKNEVVIKLKYPFPPFLSVLAGATAKVLPENLNGHFFDKPIGSGPFKVTAITKEAGSDRGEIVLTRFDSYAGEKPKVSKMILKARSEDEAIKEAKNGKLYDLANYPLSGNEEIFKGGGDVESPLAATWIIGLNARLAPFNQLSIRKAFKASVDSEGFRKTFYPDAIPATGYIPNGMPGHIESKAISFHKIRAPKTKQIVIAFPELLSHEKEMREYLEGSLRQQGWNIKFVPMSWDKLMEGYDKKTLQGFVLSMNLDYPDTEFLVRNFESNNPDNFSGLSDKKLDQILKEARSTEDRFARDRMYKTIIDRIEDLSVTVNLFYPKSHSWVNPCVRGFNSNILADYYIDYDAVAVDPKCIKDRQGHS